MAMDSTRVVKTAIKRDTHITGKRSSGQPKRRSKDNVAAEILKTKKQMFKLEKRQKKIFFSLN